MRRLLLALALVTPIAAAQQPQSPFAGLVAEYLRRDANGHSPAPDEIAAMATLQPPPDAAALRDAMPYLLKALANPDTPLRAFALTALTGLRAEAPVPDPKAPPASSQAVYKSEIAKVVAESIPPILAHLTDESPENRALTLTVVSGFNGNAPATIFPPLLDYLKRDNANPVTGLGVVQALTALGPISSETAQSIIRYLRRGDVRDTRSDLTDSIATATYQNQEINAALLRYLDTDDNGLRARVILSLPQLDLAPGVFAETQARVSQFAANTSENLQVITAAKSVTGCWTATRMTAGCPVY